MVPGMPKLSVEATLTMDEEEIAILHHISSYDRPATIAAFRSVFGSTFTDGQYSKFLDSARTATSKIKSAAVESRKHLFPGRQ